MSFRLLFVTANSLTKKLKWDGTTKNIDDTCNKLSIRPLSFSHPSETGIKTKLASFGHKKVRMSISKEIDDCQRKVS